MEGQSGHEDISYTSTRNVEWLSSEEEHDLRQWVLSLRIVLPAFVLAWVALHVMSFMSWKVVGEPRRSMAPLDKKLWHGKFVSASHALLAFGQGVFWLALSPERQVALERPFAFLPTNAFIESIGAAYFIYDVMAMCIFAHHMSRAFFWGIMIHHAIFILAYASTLVFPCTLSAMVFHAFQLTELSTFFLHLSWMASKARAQYSNLYWATLLLLASYMQRIATTFAILWHTISRLIGLKLWQMEAPKLAAAFAVPYTVMMAAGALAMLAINCTWFLQIIERTKKMIARVQHGRPPTSDYEGAVKGE